MESKCSNRMPRPGVDSIGQLRVESTNFASQREEKEMKAQGGGPTGVSVRLWKPETKPRDTEPLKPRCSHQLPRKGDGR